MWRAAPACVLSSGMGAAQIDIPAAMTLAQAFGAAPEPAAELLLAVVRGFSAAMKRRAADA